MEPRRANHRAQSDRCFVGSGRTSYLWKANRSFSEAGWVSRLTVKNLFALSKAANKTMTLTLPDSRQFTVIFDRSNGAPVEAQQVLPFAYPEDSDQYLLTLRLLTVHSG